MADEQHFTHFLEGILAQAAQQREQTQPQEAPSGKQTRIVLDVGASGVLTLLSMEGMTHVVLEMFLHGSKSRWIEFSAQSAEAFCAWWQTHRHHYHAVHVAPHTTATLDEMMTILQASGYGVIPPDAVARPTVQEG